MNYYNDNDPKIVEWLDALMRAGLIPQGHIDSRSIEDIRPDELAGFTQHHVFAGIGGWAYALKLADWPADRPVWTGSCPCQPFSIAGKGKGKADERHVWPAWRELIAECRPSTIFGEQVASPLGREWLAGVRADLEALGYAVGAADLCAASAGAPQIRQRLFWVADSDPKRFGKEGHPKSGGGPGGSGSSRGLGHSESHNQRRPGEPETMLRREVTLGGSSAWTDFDLVQCRDDKARRVESGTFPLAHGVPGRVAKLRGLGNAIVPQIAAIFVRAYLETINHGECEEGGIGRC